MKLDAMVLGCLRGVGGASLLLAAAGCGSSAPAEQGTTPVVVAQPAQNPQPTPEDPAIPQDPNQVDNSALNACGRG